MTTHRDDSAATREDVQAAARALLPLLRDFEAALDDQPTFFMSAALRHAFYMLARVAQSYAGAADHD